MSKKTVRTSSVDFYGLLFMFERKPQIMIWVFFPLNFNHWFQIWSQKSFRLINKSFSSLVWRQYPIRCKTKNCCIFKTIRYKLKTPNIFCSCLAHRNIVTQKEWKKNSFIISSIFSICQISIVTARVSKENWALGTLLVHF